MQGCLPPHDHRPSLSIATVNLATRRLHPRRRLCFGPVGDLAPTPTAVASRPPQSCRPPQCSPLSQVGHSRVRLPFFFVGRRVGARSQPVRTSFSLDPPKIPCCLCLALQPRLIIFV
ncbi:hypothetical protein EUGRSUZ_L02441 [Eucalyptus grandis]|uniref:Uncharacterized protein n=1 Tax=Eucalyptus grandis TaxID=71139 RepID=A0A058ZS11_EUCGR|nr:hypothetical protein EUGRSUZ_L02441 [Eucalyptus grandis]